MPPPRWTASTMLLRHGAPIECVRALGGDRLKRAGQFGLAESFGARGCRDHRRDAVWKKDLCRRVVSLEHGGIDGDLHDGRPVDRKPVAGQLDRRSKHLGKRHRAESLQRRSETAGHAGNGHGQRPVNIRLVAHGSATSPSPGRPRRRADTCRRGPRREPAPRSPPPRVVEFGEDTMRTPAPPNPLAHGSTTPTANAVATAASTALPPC